MTNESSHSVGTIRDEFTRRNSEISPLKASNHSTTSSQGSSKSKKGCHKRDAPHFDWKKHGAHCKATMRDHLKKRNSAPNLRVPNKTVANIRDQFTKRNSESNLLSSGSNHSTASKGSKSNRHKGARRGDNQEEPEFNWEEETGSKKKTEKTDHDRICKRVCL